MTQAVTLGEALIDFVSTETGVQLTEASSFHRRYGGSMANVAMGLARLDVNVGFAGMVGEDAFGDFLEHTMQEEKIDTAGLHHHPRLRTTLAFVSVTDNAIPDFQFFRHPGADSAMSFDKIPRPYLEDAQVLHTGSLALSAPKIRQATYRTMDRFQEQDRLVSLDPNLRLSLWDSKDAAVEDIMEAVRKADLVKCSEEEAEFLTGREALSSSAEGLRSQGPELVIITKGSEGSYAQTSGIEASYSSYSVNAVDTTGAGDGFSAGILSALLNGGLERFPPGQESLDEAIHYASAAAAMTTTDVGTATALPQLSEVRTFLKNRNPLR